MAKTDTVRYETTFVSKIDLTDEKLQALKDRVTNAIKKFDGEVAQMDDWGKKRMAYPIQKETRGQYTFCVYTGNNKAVAEVERNLRLQESVLRFLTVIEDANRPKPSEFRREDADE